MRARQTRGVAGAVRHHAGKPVVRGARAAAERSGCRRGGSRGREKYWRDRLWNGAGGVTAAHPAAHPVAAGVRAPGAAPIHGRKIAFTLTNSFMPKRRVRARSRNSSHPRTACSDRRAPKEVDGGTIPVSNRSRASSSAWASSLQKMPPPSRSGCRWQGAWHPRHPWRGMIDATGPKNLVVIGRMPEGGRRPAQWQEKKGPRPVGRRTTAQDRWRPRRRCPPPATSPCRTGPGWRAVELAVRVGGIAHRDGLSSAPRRRRRRRRRPCR